MFFGYVLIFVVDCSCDVDEYDDVGVGDEGFVYFRSDFLSFWVCVCCVEEFDDGFVVFEVIGIDVEVFCCVVFVESVWC